MSDVFISYRHKDDDHSCEGYYIANLLANSLNFDGYSFFFDKSSEKGMPFNGKCEPEIKNCKDFIVILDKDTFQRTLKGEKKESDGLRKELSLAVKIAKSEEKKKKKKYFRVELPDFIMPDDLPEDIVGIKDFDCIKYDKEDDFDSFNNFYQKLTPHLKTRPPIKKLLIPFWPLLLGIVMALFGGGSWYAWKTSNELDKNKQELDSLKQKAKEPVLLLVGAGSVKGFFENRKNDSIDSIPITTSKEWVYIPTSTGAALPIISKEIDVQQNNGDDTSRQYNLVVFSAIRADDTDLISDSTTKDKFITNIGHVIGTKIGSIDLKVVFKDDDYFKKYLGDDKLLTPEVLAEIVNDKTVTVFTTSNNNGNRGISGTFKRYTEILKDRVDLEKKHCEEFISNQTFTPFINVKNPFVILESSTFAVDSTNKDAGWFSVPIYYDETKQKKLKNDLYVYYVAHKKPNGGDESYYVPEQVRHFLISNKIVDIIPDDKDLLFNPDSLIQEYNKDGTRCKE